MKLNSYNITARIYPAIITSIPFYVFHFFYLSPTLGQFWGDLLGIQIASDATIILALLFLFAQLNRHVSKQLFQNKMFAKGLAFPTTDYLLHFDSHFSKPYRSQIHAKIKNDFGIDIPSHEEEKQDPAHARKIINEAIGRVRVKVGDGKLVGQHNAEYGFARNLAGGAIIALCMSVADAIFFAVLHDAVAAWFSVALIVIYFLVIIFSKQIINAFAHHYAEKLIDEYMAA
jgi:hypothetical protein